MRFGRHLVLDRLTLDIRPGEITAIVGGSGSGKSTLMRILAMLQRPTAGQVTLFGEPVPTSDGALDLALRRRLGVMFQHGALFSNLTVLENICVPIDEHTSLSRQLVEELAMLKLLLAGLDGNSASLYPGELSGGMRKRAAVARGIALDPQILFLDEPSSGLDPVSADAMDDLILDLKATLGLTVVLVTHDMNSLWRVADRVLLLADAQIIADGSLGDVLAVTAPAAHAFLHSRRGRAAEAVSGK